jgi:MFS family permease
MIHRFGAHSTLIGLTITVFIGVFTYGCGVQAKSFYVMFIGRILLGLGAESLAVVQSSFITKYFASNELSFALALSLSVGRLTSVMNYNINPGIAGEKGVAFASWVPSVVSSMSVICSFIAVLLDNQLRNMQVVESVALDEPDKEPAVVLDVTRKKAPLAARRSRPASNSSRDNLAEPIELKQESVLQTRHNFARKYLGIFASVLPRDFFDLPYSFWMLTIVLIFFTTSTINFLPIAPLFLKAKYFPNDQSSDTATSLVSVPDSFSVLIMPFIGYFSDKLADYFSLKSVGITSPLVRSIGIQIQKAKQCFWSGMALFIAHSLFAFSSIHPLYPLLCLGVGYAGFGSILYSLMADLVRPLSKAREDNETDLEEVEEDKKQEDESEGIVASAYGTSGCLTNLSFTIAPIIVASILSSSEGASVNAYFHMELFFVANTLIGVLGALELQRHLTAKKKELEIALSGE